MAILSQNTTRLIKAGALAGLLSCVVAARSEEITPTEYEVKAAFLYNFAKFVEWPATALPEKKQPFIIGILGEDPFGDRLDRIVAGKQIQSHSIGIKRSKRVEELTACQIVFISDFAKGRLSPVLDVLHKKNILTVSDMEQFAELGGDIQFVISERRVRFVINAAAAQRAGLKLSSKLLALALEVLHSPGQKGGT